MRRSVRTEFPSHLKARALLSSIREGGYAMKHLRMAAMWASLLLLVACSKSAVNSTMDTANAVGAKVMAPLEQRDASQQAESLIRLLYDRPECQAFKDQLMAAGKGSPAAGSTQTAILKAYEAAKQAGCRKSD